ncbi:MAG: hypothetical protein ACI3XA_06765 [Clostridia bacterium]
MPKLKKMPRLKGDVPFFYTREAMYTICTTINALAGAIDFLAERVEQLEAEKEEAEAALKERDK